MGEELHPRLSLVEAHQLLLIGGKIIPCCDHRIEQPACPEIGERHRYLGGLAHGHADRPRWHGRRDHDVDGSFPGNVAESTGFVASIFWAE